MCSIFCQDTFFLIRNFIDRSTWDSGRFTFGVVYWPDYNDILIYLIDHNSQLESSI